MTGDEAVLAVIEVLESFGVDYMLVGSLSSNFYGSLHATEGADFVIQPGKADLFELSQRLGPAFQLDKQAAFETASMTVHQVMRVAGSNFKIELFQLSDDEHDQERFHRRVRTKLLGRDVWLPRAENVLITKLYWAAGRTGTKDRDDVRNIIAVQSDQLDWGYIYSWADRHGTRALLDEIRGEIPTDV